MIAHCHNADGKEAGVWHDITAILIHILIQGEVPCDTSLHQDGLD